jgi:hypothetical protein
MEKKTQPTKKSALVDYFDLEAERFKQLAKEYALKALLNHGNTDDAQTARNHLIRAETYKDAARIAAGHHV